MLVTTKSYCHIPPSSLVVTNYHIFNSDSESHDLLQQLTTSHEVFTIKNKVSIVTHHAMDIIHRTVETLKAKGFLVRIIGKSPSPDLILNYFTDPLLVCIGGWGFVELKLDNPDGKHSREVVCYYKPEIILKGNTDTVPLVSRNAKRITLSDKLVTITGDKLRFFIMDSIALRQHTKANNRISVEVGINGDSLSFYRKRKI